jgi:predicted membrane chloride channel (bestrophin family)
VESGLLLENEKDLLVDIKSGIPKYPTHWVPMVWACSIVTRARREEKIKNDSVVKSLIDEINKIKDQCFLLLSYDWISVPLVYTQVVTLSVYTYFFSCLMGRQWVLYPGKVPGEGSSSSVKATKYGIDELDLFIPVFTILQFFFYMGWLKVAESLLNPFGDDDDDFELNW